jgi:hypothetical protein
MDKILTHSFLSNQADLLVSDLKQKFPLGKILKVSPERHHESSKEGKHEKTT